MADDDDLRLRVEGLASVCSRLEGLPAEAWEPPEPPPLDRPVADELAPEGGTVEKAQRRRRSLLPRPLAAGALAAGLIGAGFGIGLAVEGDEPGGSAGV